MHCLVVRRIYIRPARRWAGVHGGMITLKSLFVFDLSAILIMLIISHLSSRLGEALKIRPYYRLLYLSAAAIAASACMDAVFRAEHSQLLGIAAMALRAVAACVALCTCLPYWKWLFAEYSHRKR
jgi:hypothetical protein